MQNFLNFIVKFKEFITFGAFVVISLSLISLGNVSEIGGFRTVVIGSVGWMQEIFSFVPNPGALQSENRALRELNLQLSAEVTRMRNSLIENKKLREMLEMEEEQGNPLYISAEVIGKSSIELRQYYTLSSGKEDGVEVGMAVRSAAGLVGVVMGSSDSYSLVELISNRNIKISAKIQRTDISGVLVWEGGKYFKMKNIPESFDVQVGDIVVTSNFSNKYPADIPIAQVVNIEKDPSSLFLKIELKPFVDFSATEEVFVIKEVPDQERIKLIKEMEERILARTGKN